MAARKSPKRNVKRGAAKRAPRRPAARKVRSGRISHTELASSDPDATRAWCKAVLGWKFVAPMPTPGGPYHMVNFGDNTGGGIRSNNPPEVPGTIPYCEVPSIRTAYQKALRAGAAEMLPPDELPGGMGWMAIVRAPGGVAIGFWGPK